MSYARFPARRLAPPAGSLGARGNAFVPVLAFMEYSIPGLRDSVKSFFLSLQYVRAGVTGGDAGGFSFLNSQ